MVGNQFKVLVVDDSPGDQLLFKESMVEAGIDCKVMTAQSVKESIKMIYDESPNLIIMDINMPGVKGDDFVSMLKSSSLTTNHIPVVFLTGEGMGFRKIDPESKELVVNDKKYPLLKKPPDPKELKKIFSRYI